MVTTIQAAIDSALAQNWLTAIKLNKELIKNNKDDIDSLARLAYALTQINDIEKAKKIYKKILSLDKYNSLAQKNLDKIINIPKGSSAKQTKERVSPGLFIEEPGKTKVINLINLATNKAHVEGTNLDVGRLISAVRQAGYSATLADASSEEKRSEVRSWLIRVVVAGVFALPLLYLSMGHMLALPVPMWSTKTLVIVQLLLATPIVLAGWNFYTNGFRSLLNLNPNMDTLVAIGTGTAYVYSLFVAVMILLDNAGYLPGMEYFEIAGLIIAFILLGKFLESVAKGKTSQAIKKLLGLQPKTALVLKGKEEVVVALESRDRGVPFSTRPLASLLQEDEGFSA